MTAGLARRSLLGASVAAVGSGFVLPGCDAHAGAATPPDTANLTAAQALTRLRKGNRRWVTGELAERDPAAVRRALVAGGQNPFAAVFTCIDSRVPPECIYDQDLGDLFVVRTAGEVLDPLVGGSLEYGPAHGTPLVVVLGHSSCGAVKATVESIEDGVSLPGHLTAVVAALRPAYLYAKPGFRPGWDRARRVEAIALAQVDLTVARLRADPVLARAKVVGGFYDLVTGAVGYLDQP